MRILIVEDDRDMNKIIFQHLAACGYSVDACMDGPDARAMIENTFFDVIVMDILLPRDNGLDIIRWMRGKGIGSAVILLTAKDSISDRIEGLDAGADDYMTKPFALDELSARVRALSRRLTENRDNIYQIADLTLDIKRRVVTRAGAEIELSLREFAILEYMVRNAGIVLSREQIEHYIWNYDYIGNSNIVEVYISGLRKKIDAGHSQKLIHTVRSVGYTIREQEP
ncbi:MAG: response regulator transcription factor [Clostridia bacterium]|nr:response regulator transcription factor [Clostridia bacterium]MBQ6122278.1 response regulator transcription factor [Clostridia bacterium]MBQ6325695.1 response regulator transcription factor [Clostridia bacterium]